MNSSDTRTIVDLERKVQHLEAKYIEACYKVGEVEVAYGETLILLKRERERAVQVEKQLTEERANADELRIALAIAKGKAPMVTGDYGLSGNAISWRDRALNAEKLLPYVLCGAIPPPQGEEQSTLVYTEE